MGLRTKLSTVELFCALLKIAKVYCFSVKFLEKRLKFRQRFRKIRLYPNCPNHCHCLLSFETMTFSTAHSSIEMKFLVIDNLMTMNYVVWALRVRLNVKLQLDDTSLREFNSLATNAYWLLSGQASIVFTWKGRKSKFLPLSNDVIKLEKFMHFQHKTVSRCTKFPFDPQAFTFEASPLASKTSLTTLLE